jgi:hypothetical protein
MAIRHDDDKDSIKPTKSLCCQASGLSGPGNCSNKIGQVSLAPEAGEGAGPGRDCPQSAQRMTGREAGQAETDPGEHRNFECRRCMLLALRRLMTRRRAVQEVDRSGRIPNCGDAVLRMGSQHGSCSGGADGRRKAASAMVAAAISALNVAT